MELQAHNIEIIRLNIIERGVTMPDLQESLLDHICCQLELSDSKDFDQALQKALDSFGISGLRQVQQATNYIINKNNIIMKKSMFILGYLAATLCSTGLLFKIQHWQGASILLVLGIAILNFGFLPLWFYRRMKNEAALLSR